MIHVLHLVRSFGNVNQPYTTKLLENINFLSKESSHQVVCNRVFFKSNKIDTLVTQDKKTLFEFASIKFVFAQLFFNSKLRILLKSYSLKQKIDFLFKWMPILNTKFDVLHVHHMQSINTIVLELLKEKKVKIVCSLRGHDLLVNTLKPENTQLLKKKLKFIDEVHVISFFMKNEAIKKGFISNINVVYRGTDLILNDVSTEFELGGQIKLIAVGRLVWEKGHIYAIESIHRLIKKGVNIILDIYGEGILYESLMFRIKQLGLEKVINLKGYLPIEELQLKYKDYHAAIQPSISEALSNGLLDLAINNVPCVISNVGGMLEIIEDNVNGKVFDIKNLEQLDDAIMNVLNLDKVKLKAHNLKLRNKFSLDNEVKGLESIYLT